MHACTCTSFSFTNTMIRRLCCLQSATPSFAFSSNTNTKKKPLVLLGAPQVSAIVLDALLNASSASDSLFQVPTLIPHYYYLFFVLYNIIMTIEKLEKLVRNRDLVGRNSILYCLGCSYCYSATC